MEVDSSTRQVISGREYVRHHYQVPRDLQSTQSVEIAQEVECSPGMLNALGSLHKSGVVSAFP